MITMTLLHQRSPCSHLLSPKSYARVAQHIAGAHDAIFGHNSAHSFATGPWMAEPFIAPFSFTMTPALSSKYTKTPSARLQAFFCLMTTPLSTFFRNSGFPFLQLQRNVARSAIWEDVQAATDTLH